MNTPGSAFNLPPSSLPSKVLEVWMDLKLDDGLKTLIDQGKEKGYFTFTQVNVFLPDDAVNHEKLDQLLGLLEEKGIELIDEDEAQDREGATTTTREAGEADIEAELREI